MGRLLDAIWHWDTLSEEKQQELLMELAYAHRGNTNFNSCLLRLLAKCDCGNLSKMFSVYPDLVAVSQAFKEGIVSLDEWRKIEDEAAEQDRRVDPGGGS